MKLRPVETKFYHADVQKRQADERTDGRDEVSSRYSQFCERT
jgi:hypothetical protein